MEQCAQCGHTLGIGRYCVNCGQPHGQSADTAVPGTPGPADTSERPAVPPGPPTESLSPPTQLSEPTQAPWGPTTPRPAAPPPVYETPPQARYPMYADEPRAAADPALPPPVWEISPAGGGHAGGDRRSLLPWIAVAVALVLVAGIGIFLLVGGDGDEPKADPAPDPGTSVTDPGTSPGDSTSPDTGPPETDPTSPSTPPVDGETVDVGRLATVIPYDTAEPGRDVNGNAVRYDGFNMLDGQDDTAWRVDGDASGNSIAFELATPTHLTSVGLLNGYAKRDPGYDGYTANRRILQVEWTFDDGTVVPQTLDGGTRAVQSIDVDAVTSTVQLVILGTSRPGKGPSGRNFTAISTVELLGVPQ